MYKQMNVMNVTETSTDLTGIINLHLEKERVLTSAWPKVGRRVVLSAE
jgi:hypothetical protein